MQISTIDILNRTRHLYESERGDAKNVANVLLFAAHDVHRQIELLGEDGLRALDEALVLWETGASSDVKEGSVFKALTLARRAARELILEKLAKN